MVKEIVLNKKAREAWISKEVDRLSLALAYVADMGIDYLQDTCPDNISEEVLDEFERRYPNVSVFTDAEYNDKVEVTFLIKH